jgi:putative transposase
MYREGSNKKSIADLLELSRQHVARLIKAFEQEGFDSFLDNRTRPANHPDNQMTLPFLEDVFTVQQEYPKAGRFRVHGILEYLKGEDAVPSRRTLGRAMAYNRVLRGAPEAWTTNKKKDDVEKEPLPFTPVFRHQYWFIDIRYLVKLEGKWVYSICIIEGYSRKFLAGMSSPHQDELAVLQLLHAALANYGCPHTIVSDNGSVFLANAYKQLLKKLDIEFEHIEKGTPWQNLIEAQFKVQSRLADAKFEQSKTLTEIQQQHAVFVQLFNSTNHNAHKDRLDGLTTPTAVLGIKMERTVDASVLRRAFRHLQFTRTITSNGYPDC